MRVGFESHNYGAARNVYAPMEGVTYLKVRRLPVERLPLLTRRGSGSVSLTFPQQSVDFTHIWLRTALTNRPWGASFSSQYPWVNQIQHPKLFGLLRTQIQRQNCRFLIPISEYARRRAASVIGSSVWSEIEHKVRVVPPYHRATLRTTPYEVPNASERLRLLFVGVTFFGKGGEAVLNVFERLCEELNLELTVVSPVAGSDYDHTPPEHVDVDDVRRRLATHSRIRWVERLTNSDVLAEMEECHVGLLPTLADTYGYVMLEYMGLGVPTVVSNVQALPEFTSPDASWIIEIDRDEDGVWKGRQPGRVHRSECYQTALETIERSLEEALRDARRQPDALSQMSERAIRKISDCFDPRERNAKLRAVYEELACPQG